MHGGEIIAGSGKTKKVKKDKQSRAMKHGKSGTAAMEDPGKVEVADDVAMDDMLFYEIDKYKYAKNAEGGRTPVDPQAHAAIRNALSEWQRHNEGERPIAGEWYWKLRCALIDGGLFTKYHCWDVRRDSVRDFLKKRKAASSRDTIAQDAI